MEYDLEIDFSKIIISLKKYWWIPIILSLGAGLATYSYSQTLPHLYQATTTLMVGQSIQAVELTTRDLELSSVLAETYSDMARRQPVLQAVVDGLALEMSWKSLKSQIDVSALRGTQLIQIKATAESPEQAQLIADEVANQLILLSPTNIQNQKNEEIQTFVLQRLKNLQDKIEAGQQNLETLEAALSDSLTAKQIEEIQREINTMERLITDWENTYTKLLTLFQSDQSPNHLAIIEPAQASSNPVSPDTFLYTGAAGGASFALGFALILLLGFLDKRIYSADVLHRSLNLTVLGSVGKIKKKSTQAKLVTSLAATSPILEAYRMVRTNIQFLFINRQMKSLLMTSAAPDEGKSVTAANLGIIFARAGLRVIVVDADLRQPTLHKIFQTPNTSGLTHLLGMPQLEKIETYLSETDIDNLKILTSGLLPANPPELLGSPKMAELAAHLYQLADIVIYDSPPILAVTDAIVLSSQVDGVIMVTKAKQTKLGALKRAIGALQQVEARIVGGILNQVSAGSGQDYYPQYYPDLRQTTGQPIKSKLQIKR